jgi:hypothetical protein
MPNMVFKAIRLAMHVVGLLLGVGATYAAFFAFMFRFDTSAEYEGVLQLDAVLGCAFAIAVILFFGPDRFRGAGKHWLLTTTAAIAIGVLVGGGLTHWHWTVDRIRSGVP